MSGLTEMFDNSYEDTQAYNKYCQVFLLNLLAKYTKGELFTIVSFAYIRVYKITV